MKEREIVEKALAGMPYNECMRMVDDGALSVVSEFKGTMIGEIVVATRPTNLRVHRRDSRVHRGEDANDVLPRWRVLVCFIIIMFFPLA